MGLCFMITGQPSNQNYGFNKAIRLLHVFKENKIKYIYIYIYQFTNEKCIQ
jgi:hypothetical protein